MSDKQNTFDLEEVLHWCLQVQKARIRCGLFYEMSSQALSPVLHRELLAFAKIAQVIASNAQRTDSQSDGAGSSAEPPKKIGVREEIKNLGPEDRHLLREALNEIAANLGQPQTSNVARETVYLEEHIND